MFKRVLVPLDQSWLAESVLPHTVSLAETFGSAVTLLHIVPSASTQDEHPPIQPFDSLMRKAEAKSYLEAVVAQLNGAGIETDYTIQEGQPEGRIVQFARDQGVDLIVLSRHGGGELSNWTIGSIPHKIMLRSHLSTLLVQSHGRFGPGPHQPSPQGRERVRYRRILAPLDGSQRAENVLPLANWLARAHGAQLIVAHVVQKPEVLSHFPPSPEDEALVSRLTERNQQEATAYLSRLQRKSSTELQTRLLISNNVGLTLHQLVEAEDIDLVVMGAHGQSGQTQWPYGSVTTSFLVYGTTSLLIVQELLPHQIARTEAEERHADAPAPTVRHSVKPSP